MTITKRETKGSALTYAELDANFTHADLYKSVQNISGPGAISTTTGVTFISTTGTDDNLVGWTSVRFSGVNNNVHLCYGSTGWNIIALQQATRIS